MSRQSKTRSFSDCCLRVMLATPSAHPLRRPRTRVVSTSPCCPQGAYGCCSRYDAEGVCERRDALAKGKESRTAARRKDRISPHRALLPSQRLTQSKLPRRRTRQAGCRPRGGLARATAARADGLDLLEQNMTTLHRLLNVASDFAASTTAAAEPAIIRAYERNQAISDMEKDMVECIATSGSVSAIP